MKLHAFDFASLFPCVRTQVGHEVNQCEKQCHGRIVRYESPITARSGPETGRVRHAVQHDLLNGRGPGPTL